MQYKQPKCKEAVYLSPYTSSKIFCKGSEYLIHSIQLYSRHLTALHKDFVTTLNPTLSPLRQSQKLEVRPLGAPNFFYLLSRMDHDGRQNLC